MTSSFPMSTGSSSRRSTTDEAQQGLSDFGGDKQSSTSFTNNNEDLSLWRETIKSSIARSKKVRGGNYVQIATVDPITLEPRCRTVVFRGFLPNPPSISSNEDNSKKEEDPYIMKMITDLRSSKVQEISNQTITPPKAELVWWFTKSSEQYRILGTIQFVGASGTSALDSHSHFSEARKQQWGNLSDSAREQFYWREPNTPYQDQVKVPDGGRDENHKVLPPPDNFLLMLLFPEKVDYLRLGDNVRQVDELLHDKWISKRMNP